MRMVSFFSLFVIIILCVRPVQAQINRDYSFSLCPQFGLVSGQAEEIVYPIDTKAELLSQLLWDMKPVYYYGLLMDFSPVRPLEKWGFFSGLSMKFGIPGLSGVMEDRDWDENSAELLCYSSHDNITKELFFLDFSAGVSFPFFNALLVKTFVNISYMLFRFSGENGFGFYPWAESGKEIFSGKVISYKQEWLFAAPGVSLGYGHNGNLSAEIFFMISPLVLCSGLDQHKLEVKKRQYRDLMRGGLMLEPGFRFSVAATKWLGVSWEISWRYIKGTKGDSYERKAYPSEPIGSGIDILSANKAGAGLSVLNTALLFKVRL